MKSFGKTHNCYYQVLYLWLWLFLWSVTDSLSHRNITYNTLPCVLLQKASSYQLKCSSGFLTSKVRVTYACMGNHHPCCLWECSFKENKFLHERLLLFETSLSLMSIYYGVFKNPLGTHMQIELVVHNGIWWAGERE